MENKRAVVIGKTLRDLRDIRPRSKVAKALGIGYSTLANYEQGTRIPPDDVKIRIAEYYGKSVTDIFFPSNTTETV